MTALIGKTNILSSYYEYPKATKLPMLLLEYNKLIAHVVDSTKHEWNLLAF